MASKKKTSAKTDADPSAVREWVSRGRAASALLGFVIAFVVAYRAGVPVVDAAFRGLIAAIILSVVGWWCVLLVIQALMRAAAARRQSEAEEAARVMKAKYDAELAAARKSAQASHEPDVAPASVPES